MALETCPCCGKVHGSLSFAIPVSMPTEAAKIPVAQRDGRLWSNGELCVVDDKRFYLYGSIEINIHDHCNEFAWGAWVELVEETFFRYQKLLDVEGREANPPFEAVLGTDIPFYPPTLGLPLIVRVRKKGVRPLFQLKAGTHPLIHDQHAGVSIERIQAIKSWFCSLEPPAA